MHRAIVTGGSRGIGRAIAEELSARGHGIVLNFLKSHEQAEEVAALIRGRGGSCDLLPFDVSDAEAAQAAVSGYIRDHGTIDIVVNNAGITRDMIFPAMKFESWDRVIRTALTGFFAVTKPCIRGMLAQGFGRIITIASAAGQVGNAGQTNYSAAKAGLIGATRSLSSELCRKGILVNAVAPGFIETDMLAAVKVPRPEIERLIPMGRVGTPQEVARLVAFLASEDAGYITGQVIGVNGGML